jgi:hypothetical protein
VRPPPVVVGVDPGSRDTGIIVRWSDIVVDHLIVHRVADEAPDHGIGPIYLRSIQDGVRAMWSVAIRYDAGKGSRPDLVVTAIEAVNVPKGFAGGKKRFVAPKDSIALGIAFGAALTAVEGAVVVPVGGNGYGVLSSYPDALISAAERRHGVNREAPQNSNLRHLRSAWDVAHRGMQVKPSPVVR